MPSNACHLTLQSVIRSIRHRGLRRLWEGDPSRLNAALISRLENILAVLDAAVRPGDFDLPGHRLHPLKGNLKDHRSISVSGNWHLTFRMERGDVFDVDLADYHQEQTDMPMKNPPHPGRIVRQDCIDPIGLSIAEAAKALGVPVRR